MVIRFAVCLWVFLSIVGLGFLDAVAICCRKLILEHASRSRPRAIRSHENIRIRRPGRRHACGQWTGQRWWRTTITQNKARRRIECVSAAWSTLEEWRDRALSDGNTERFLHFCTIKLVHKIIIVGERFGLANIMMIGCWYCERRHRRASTLFVVDRFAWFGSRGCRSCSRCGALAVLILIFRLNWRLDNGLPTLVRLLF